jgi:CPA2 family monovalent cation:H+ antiporter-2
LDQIAHAGGDLGLMVEVSLALAFGLAGGLVAIRLRLPPIVGFLLAGIVLSPHTPIHQADVHTAEQLGEIGVAFLMFGVGMHFSLRDLMDVRLIAIPGAIVQSILSTILTIGIALLFGWSLGAGLVLGLALSVASTVVLVRALTSRDLLASDAGRVAIGWLVVEDLLAALVLVLLPILAVSLGGSAAAPLPESYSLIDAFFSRTDSLLAYAAREAGIPETSPTLVAVTLLNLALICALLPVLRRFVAWLLDYVDRTGSDEMLTLAGVVVALSVSFGIAIACGMSIALTAFFAGIVVAASPHAHRVSEDLRPLRNLFGVLFFASVGMLLDPMTLVREPLKVLVVVLIIVLAKPAIAATTALLLRQPPAMAHTIGAGLGQIGEFSFILGTLGRSLGLLTDEAYQLIIAGAILSIALNPVIFRLSEKLGHFWGPAASLASAEGDLAALEVPSLFTPDLVADDGSRRAGERE